MITSPCVNDLRKKQGEFKFIKIEKSRKFEPTW